MELGRVLWIGCLCPKWAAFPFLDVSGAVNSLLLAECQVRSLEKHMGGPAFPVCLGGGQSSDNTSVLTLPRLEGGEQLGEPRDQVAGQPM